MSAAEVLAESLRETDYDWSVEWGRAAYLARAMKNIDDLKAAGYEVAELPDPDYGDCWTIPSCGEFKGVESTGDSCTSVEITEDGVEVDVFGELTPAECRLLAAALLAAADAAEAAS